MTKLVILEYPDPRLRTTAKPVEMVDDAVRQLVADLLETMYAAKGIGLAATQVDVPDIYDKVQRATLIRVRALGTDGQPFELDVEGILAVCVQHEMDHLQGKLFVDYLSELKRQMIRRRLEKERKQRESGGAAPRRATSGALPSAQ